MKSSSNQSQAEREFIYSAKHGTGPMGYFAVQLPDMPRCLKPPLPIRFYLNYLLTLGLKGDWDAFRLPPYANEVRNLTEVPG